MAFLCVGRGRGSEGSWQGRGEEDGCHMQQVDVQGKSRAVALTAQREQETDTRAPDFKGDKEQMRNMHKRTDST